MGLLNLAVLRMGPRRVTAAFLDWIGVLLPSSFVLVFGWMDEGRAYEGLKCEDGGLPGSKRMGWRSRYHR